jgi:hypothetical protein
MLLLPIRHPVIEFHRRVRGLSITTDGWLSGRDELGHPLILLIRLTTMDPVGDKEAGEEDNHACHPEEHKIHEIHDERLCSHPGSDTGVPATRVCHASGI